MNPKLFALLLGFLLIGVGVYFQQPANAPGAEETVDSEQEAPSRPVIPAKQGLFQTVSFHPSDISEPALRNENALPALNNFEAEAHWNSIADLVSCANTSKNCAVELPDSDPSARFFTIRDRILDEMDWFLEHRAAGAQQAARLSQVAESLIAVPDEQVQARALDLEVNSPVPNPKMPELIAKNMPDIVDTDLTKKVAQIFARNLKSSTPNVETVVNYTCNTILYGAILSSKEMARLVSEVLTDSTRPGLEACMAKLPKGERLQSMREALYPSAGST